MKSGANYVVLAKLNEEIEDIEKIYFTFANGKNKIVKEYPGSDVSENNGIYAISLYQLDTEKLVGNVNCEAQINYKDKAVAKTNITTFFMSSTLNTEHLEGDTPRISPDKEIEFSIEGDAIIAKVIGDIDPQEIETAVQKYLDEHPIQAGISKEECETIVAEYVTEHKDELKGDKGERGEQGIQGIQGERGEKGDKGDVGAQGIQGPKGDNGADGRDGVNGKDGKDYVITSTDYDAIAEVVLTKLDVAESEEY